MTNKITINGTTYTPEELGLERLTINGKKYLDVTPFWLDCEKARCIERQIHGERPRPEDFRREMKG